MRVYALSSPLRQGSDRLDHQVDAVEIRYMVMDLLNEPLADIAETFLCKSNSEKLDFIHRIALNALSILRGVHSNGIVHGDIHAGAFMFDGSNELRIIDFGKARRVRSDAVPKFRTMIDEGGYWALPDRPSLLSEFELESGRHPTYQDDLIRLGEMLYKIYDTFAYGRLFDRIITARLDKAAICVSQIIQFKRALCSNALELKDPPTSLDAFYGYVRGMNVDMPVDYDSMLRIFNPKITALAEA